VKDLKTQMQNELDSVTVKLLKAQDKAAVANRRVQELERQQVALQSALDIMEGKGPVIQQYKPFDPAIAITGAKWGPSRTLDFGTATEMAQDNYVEFNGDRILLEPGFRVGKNSFGEDVLLPENMPDPEPLPEPTVPIAPPSILPPIGQDAGFASEIPGDF
jgi:hypothetical protein